VQFTFTKGTNGAYTAVLNSPDNPALKNTAVSGVSWDGTNLKMQVPSLSGSFAGALKGGSIGGQWTQPGSTLPLALAPYQKPVLTAAAAKSITGNWNGVITVAQGVTQNVNIEFKPAADGGIEGVFGLPDQGAKLPFKDVLFENGEVSMKISQGQAVLDYKGKLAGDAITGKLKVPSPAAPADGLPLNLKRGEYKPASAALKLSAESFAALKGKWTGQLELTNPQTQAKQTINLVLRFESNAKNEYVAFVDSPNQNANGIVVSDVTLADGKLSLKVAAIGGEYTGTLAGKTLTGEWAQPARSFRQALVLTRQQ
jgi:hypothetical protein